MRKIFYLLSSLLLLNTVSAQVPISEVDSLIADCKSKVREIDNQILYKERIGRDSYDEWIFTHYFDNEGSLKKTIFAYQCESNESCLIYFDTNGVAIYTSFYELDMNGAYSIERYLNEEGKLLYVNHVSKDDHRVPLSEELIVHEQIIRRGFYTTDYPRTNTSIYDNVTSVNTFIERLRLVYDPEGIIFSEAFLEPAETIPVKFEMPVKNDITRLNQNDVIVYSKPTFESLSVDKLHIRPDIKILNTVGDWYEITLEMPYNEDFRGYIHKDFLAPVERIIK